MHKCTLIISLPQARKGPNSEGWWLSRTFVHPIDRLGYEIDDDAFVDYDDDE